jgi:cytochrome P450
MTGTEETCGRFDDFDLQDPGFLADPATVWQGMRQECPVAHSDRDGGGWMLSRRQDITAVALDPSTYSSRAGEVTGPVPQPGRELKLPPVTSDPPEHAGDRKLLMPFFNKMAVDELEPLTRATARELLDDLVSHAEVDAVESFARVIPVVVTTHMLGLPPEDRPKFQRWTLRMLADGAQDQTVRAEAVREIRGYFQQRLAAGETTAQGGVMGYLLSRRAEGVPLSDERIVGMSFLMLIAGIDTTWSALGTSLWHLASTPSDRQLLVERPELVPNAVEELLRAYAPVTIGRVVTRDTTLAGRTLHAGDRVVVPWAAANRDPDLHDDPDAVRLDRDSPRHHAFGVGIHRCLGAQLAQMELRVALEEWLARVPDFALVSSEVEWSAGNTRGPVSLRLRLSAGGPE